MTHPLDISHILEKKGISINEDQPSNSHKKQKSSGIEPVQQKAHATPRIKSQYWLQLNDECRRFLTSKMWKVHDFNPMLEHLDDISLLTEKWMKWAVPTYVNGMSGGPILDWIEGRNRDKDFHYILVGEHLRFVKEKRKQRKSEKKIIRVRESYNKAVSELTDHLQWFQSFIQGQSAQPQTI